MCQRLRNDLDRCATLPLSNVGGLHVTTYLCDFADNLKLSFFSFRQDE